MREQNASAKNATIILIKVKDGKEVEDYKIHTKSEIKSIILIWVIYVEVLIPIL